MDFLQISYAFQQRKNFENQLRFDTVTDRLKVGTQCMYVYN